MRAIGTGPVTSTPSACAMRWLVSRLVASPASFAHAPTHGLWCDAHLPSVRLMPRHSHPPGAQCTKRSSGDALLVALLTCFTRPQAVSVSPRASTSLGSAHWEACTSRRAARTSTHSRARAEGVAFTAREAPRHSRAV